MTRDQIIQFIKEVHIGYLATICADNTPRVRPLSAHTFYDGDLYFFTFSNTRKCAEMEANPEVEVVWMKMNDMSQVRLRGKAVLVEDQDVQRKFKEDDPKVSQMLPPGTEQLFRLYCIKPQKVEIAEGLVPYKEVAW
jgi:uncharacterized pyridoxamine 5'-phosphate oxidase family protein